MKRVLALLLSAALCLGLAACRRQSPDAPSDTPDDPIVDPGVPADEPLRLDALNVEFAVGDRDPDMLLALQREFPQALRDALARQLVEVDSVTVTFGPSGEATESALQNGAVQLAFLSAEDYFPYRSGMVVAVEQGEGPDLTLGLVVSAVSDDDAADERLAEALRAALPDLAELLEPYTSEYAAGCYTYDAELLEQLSRLYDTGDAALRTVSATVDGGRELTVKAVGHPSEYGVWAIHTLEVYEGETLLQSVTVRDMTAQACASEPDFAEYPDIYIEDETASPFLEDCLIAGDLNFDGADDLRLSLRMGNVNTCWLCLLWDGERFGSALDLVGYDLTVDAAARRVVTASRDGWGRYDREYYAPDESGGLRLVRREEDHAADPSDENAKGERIIYELQNGELVETAREPWDAGD